ncbi:MAG: hypothetical protein R3F30_13935 [Planctomycetota bacterium]
MKSTWLILPLLLVAWSQQTQEPRTVKEVRFENDKGSLFIGAGEDGYPVIRLERKGGGELRIGVDDEAAYIRGTMGDKKPFFRMLSSQTGSARIDLGDQRGPLVTMQARGTGDDRQGFLGVAGRRKSSVELGFKSDALLPALIARGEDGKPRAYLGVIGADAGALRLYSREGNPMASIEAAADGVRQLSLNYVPTESRPSGTRSPTTASSRGSSTRRVCRGSCWPWTRKGYLPSSSPPRTARASSSSVPTRRRARVKVDASALLLFLALAPPEPRTRQDVGSIEIPCEHGLIRVGYEAGTGACLAVVGEHGLGLVVKLEEEAVLVKVKAPQDEASFFLDGDIAGAKARSGHLSVKCFANKGAGQLCIWDKEDIAVRVNERGFPALYLNHVNRFPIVLGVSFPGSGTMLVGPQKAPAFGMSELDNAAVLLLHSPGGRLQAGFMNYRGGYASVANSKSDGDRKLLMTARPGWGDILLEDDEGERPFR